MNIWEQQHNETAKQYAAFTAYCALPTAQRSVQAAWRVYAAKQKRKKAAISKQASQAFRAWSRVFNWQERAKAFDQWQAIELRRVTMEEQCTFIKTLFAAQQEALEAALERLDKAPLRDVVAFLQYATSMTGTQAHAEMAALERLKEAVD
jgi:hypothetical protein